jgi:outer membrane lipoprotein-sorting protein
MKSTIFAGILILLSTSAIAKDNYYRIIYHEGSKPDSYSGKSEMTIKELKKVSLEDGFITLTDIFYFKKGKIIKWKDWDENMKSEVHIRTNTIVYIHEYDGDPHKRNAE